MSNAVIHLARDEKEKEAVKDPVHRIAHEIYDFADETVAHAEGVSQEEVMLECYHQLGKLLAQWAKKLDKIAPVNAQPAWLQEHVSEQEKTLGRSWVELGRESLGFEVEGLFFAREKGGAAQLSTDALLVSQPNTMWMEDFRGLIKLCEKNGLDFYVDGFNTRLPGRAMRVVVYKPKSGVPYTHQEFRESTLLALQMYRELARGKEAISKEALVRALVDRAKFDRVYAEGIAEILASSGRIPA